MSDFELAKGRVLHFNEDSWNRLQEVLAEKRLHLMAEHVAEQRKKDVVVLDLDDYPFQCDDALTAGWLRAVADRAEEMGGASPNVRFARWIADEIEAQAKPPRIPEPGPWGVVRDGSGEDWVRVGMDRTSSLEWLSPSTGDRRDWDDIHAVREIIRPGIEGEQ